MDFAIETSVILAGATVAVTGGVAWGAVKQALNGTRERVDKLEAHSSNHSDLLARLETKVDILIERE